MVAQGAKTALMGMSQQAAFGGGGHALRPKVDGGRIKVVDEM